MSVYGPLTNEELNVLKSEINDKFTSNFSDGELRKLANHRLQEIDRNSDPDATMEPHSLTSELTKALSVIISDRKFIEESKEVLQGE
jgi:hypothetical protein